MPAALIAAIGTPLRDDESLHREGLAAHLEDQWRGGISGVLVAGSMGLMQLLTESTYRDLVRQAVALGAGRGEVMVGAGDTSFARTREKIQYVEQFDVDGIVVLAPFFYSLSQPELVRYFSALADLSRRPLYLYDLPGTTKTKLEMETVLKLSKHPNIRGIKCSCEWTWIRELIQRVGDGFRVIPAQALLVDMLVRCGVRENLDGIFALAPRWAVSIAEAADQGQWELAERRQRRLASLLHLLTRGRYPLFPAFSAILNARGIPGQFFPAPLESLGEREREQLLAEPIVAELLAEPQAQGDRNDG